MTGISSDGVLSDDLLDDLIIGFSVCCFLFCFRRKINYV